MSAPAAYATAPTPGVVHEAATIGKMGRVLGTALMPWQHQVARVATERRRDGRGWRYPVVVLTVPRQSGKTTLMRAVMAQRTLRYPGHRAFYTAQTGKDARDRWKDLADAAQKQFPQLVTIRRGAGAECVEWKNGGGQIRTFAPTRDAIHGSTPHLVMLDEAFALDEELGASLMGGIVGSQAALGHERQIWIVSTAGDAESTWFRAWVEKGREAVGDPLAALAYFEWSAPDHLDLTDPASFPLFHPAVGHTQDAETLAANAETMSRAEFERAFGNRWVAARTTVISVDDWRATINREQNPPGPDASDLVLAYDVAPDRAAAAIWAAWTDPAGLHVRPYMSRPGTAWLVPALTEAAALGRRLAADDGGPARSITAALALDSISVTVLPARDFAAATGDLIERFTTRTIDHPGDHNMAKAVEGAALRRLGETDAWSRRESTGPVHELIAATVAVRVCTYTYAAPTPMVVFA